MHLVLVAACAPTTSDLAPNASSEPVSVESSAQTHQPIVGGSPETRFPAVGAVQIGAGHCSGVAVAPRVVLTAAHCAVAGLGRANPGSVDFGDVIPSATTAAIVDLWIDRRYDPAKTAYDLALLRLDRDAPASFEIVDASAVFPVGLPVLVVGYGLSSPSDASSYGTRRSLSLATDPSTTMVGSSFSLFGSSGMSTCVGDSGGPVLFVDQTATHLLGVVSSGSEQCDGVINVAVASVDPDVETVVRAWSGPCPADGTCDASCESDPDCNPCDFEGTCQPDCPTPDLDCTLDGGPGATCVLNAECESRICTPAPEGADRGSFCSAACATSADCPAPLDDCANGICVYAAGTPGIPGAACREDKDCRTLLCEDAGHTCAVQCGPDYSCPVGLLCEPVRNARACISGPGCAAGARGGLASCLAILALLGIGRRLTQAGRQTRRRR